MLKKWLKASRDSLEHFLLQLWEKRGFWACLLFPFSLVFAATVCMRRWSFRWGWRSTEYLRVPVVVVGNLRVGGTGKTPIVIALVAALRAAGYQPGVIARGYGVRFAGVRSVAPHDVADQVGDEPLLIAQRTRSPVWIGAKRVAAGRALCAAHPEVDIIISDDGLQHYQLGRDIEWVVWDERLAGNGFLLPAGPLREPLSRSCDATLLNQSESTSPAAGNALLQQLSRQSAHASIFIVQRKIGLAWCLAHPLEQRPLSTFADKKVVAAAGIGSPEHFFENLRSYGIKPVTHAFPDHFAYDTTTFLGLDAQAILITEKDAVKCLAVLSSEIAARTWVVPVDALLAPECIHILLHTLKVLGRLDRENLF